MITELGKYNTQRTGRKVKYNVRQQKEPEVTEYSRRKLDTFYQHWVSLQKNKREWQRNSEYYDGDQWHEMTLDDNGLAVSEREKISGQGKVPLQYNIIKPACNSLIGQLRTDKSKSVVMPRAKENQAECEVLSNALQAVLATNETRELDAAAFVQKFISNLPIQYVTYKWLPEAKRYDVFLKNIDMFSMFFNTDVTDPRGTDINVIGRVLDYSYPKMLMAFGKTPHQRAQLKKIYNQREDLGYIADMNGMNSGKVFDKDFFLPKDITQCRVIEAWEKVVVERTRIHDTHDGSIQITDYTTDEVKMMNRKRIEKELASGNSADDADLMYASAELVEVWHYSYLSPYGHILAEGETPYWHGSHPFVMPMFQMVNGKLSSFVGDLIDPQRYSNRLMTLWDFILGTSAKNTLIVDKDSLAGQNIEDIADDYRQVGGVIALKMKDGQQKPFELGKNMANVGIIDMLQLTFKMVQDISGVHPSMQGQQAPNGTSGKLYAQEAQNATLNSKDMMESFATFRKQRDWKVLKTIQQFYDAPRFITIAGKSYQDTVQLYEPKDVQHLDFELQLAQSADSPIFRAVIDDQLKEFLVNGFIDFETYLENTNLPFSDKLMQSIQKAKEQAKGGDVNGAMATVGGMPTDNKNLANAENLLKRAA